MVQLEKQTGKCVDKGTAHNTVFSLHRNIAANPAGATAKKQ